MAWANGPLVVYHGTVRPFAESIATNGILLTRCLDGTDFGRGFYTTRLLSQAILHANQRYADLQDAFVRAKASFDPQGAAVVEFFLRRGDLGALDTLAFV